MPKFLMEARYTADGAKGLARDGASGRRKAVAAMVEGLGGKLEGMHYALGEVDVYIIAELPDATAAAAVALAVNQAGGAVLKTVALLSTDEVDRAGKMAIDYRPPGR